MHNNHNLVFSQLQVNEKTGSLQFNHIKNDKCVCFYNVFWCVAYFNLTHFVFYNEAAIISYFYFIDLIRPVHMSVNEPDYSRVANLT